MASHDRQLDCYLLQLEEECYLTPLAEDALLAWEDLFRLLFMTVFVFYLSAFFIIVKAHFLISSCFFFVASGFPLALVLPAASGSSLWSAISRSMTLFTASGVM